MGGHSMAVHETCPDNSKEFNLDGTDFNILDANTFISAFRCRMIDTSRENCCKSNNETPEYISGNSQYCKKCSEFYGICELCGEPLTLEYPKLISEFEYVI